jgi:hypothetical protein
VSIAIVIAIDVFLAMVCVDGVSGQTGRWRVIDVSEVGTLSPV